ncbi:diguanylate cyclase (GGDEF)-like protein [Litoreibacter ponti]|uniref:diguanylate cyclase n=1 Tax=Litoreibacter ponti TaxID=1510457 RepID=A0A2T6BIV4_9RHOB|nr:diguanylate cyclase [Litoreibacter ponti]PTX55989.1 diguanylate cyclase (GGDEF)-like protein [Litoreibacter ponti]
MGRVRLNWPEAAVALLLVTLCASVFVLHTQISRARDVVLHRAEESADILLDFAHAVHEQYSLSVAEYLDANGHVLTQDDQGTAHSLQFPASFIRTLTERYSDANIEDSSFHIYSDDPFPSARSRTLDAFARQAIAVLSEGELPRFKRIEWFEDGGARIRVATPIKMEESCEACHNEPKWGLKRNDWRAGDVRGVREVSIVVPSHELEIPTVFWSFFALVMVACLLGAGVLYPAVRRAMRQREHFAGISELLGKKALRLARQANTDPLTGLANRRSFDNMLHVYVEEYADSPFHLGLILFDLDHFKAVNDTYGHPQGDAVLIQVAHLTDASVRREDRSARVGGEEFAVLCPGGDRDSLMELADRLRRTIAGMQFETDETSARFGVTISVGVAELQPGDEPASLMKRADRNLYKAKARGRNQIFG